MGEAEVWIIPCDLSLIYRIYTASTTSSEPSKLLVGSDE